MGAGKLKNPRVELPSLGAHVTPLTADELINQLRTQRTKDKSIVVANHNLHSLYLNLTHGTFRRFYEEADIVLIDGFPVLLAARLALRKNGVLTTISAEHRIGSLDWMNQIESLGYVKKIALIGATPESNKLAVDVLKSRNPSISIQGWDGMGWTDDKATKVCDNLRAYGPDVVFVGLGMPLQESFILRFRAQFPSTIIATVGGALDQIAGQQKAAPRWLGRYGLEWLWRLATQPKRLGSRYLVEPWKLLSLLGLRRLLSTLERGGES